MKVRCISDKDAGGFVKKGESYTVYAILMSRSGLSFLLSEDYDFPMNHAVELFEILNHSLPLTWYFKFIDKKESEKRKDFLTAIWGYREIVFDKDHYYNLLEREPKEREIFARRKEEIDEYADSQKQKI